MERVRLNHEQKRALWVVVLSSIGTAAVWFLSPGGLPALGAVVVFLIFGVAAKKAIDEWAIHRHRLRQADKDARKRGLG